MLFRSGTRIAPDEAVSRLQALHACALAGAWLTREEHHKGPLAPGCLADLCVLDRDYFTCAAEEIKNIRVDLTVLHGAVAYERS